MSDAPCPSEALKAATRHLDDLEHNRVPAKDKPSAFHHGLITQLVRDLQSYWAAYDLGMQSNIRTRDLSNSGCEG